MMLGKTYPCDNETDMVGISADYSEPVIWDEIRRRGSSRGSLRIGRRALFYPIFIDKINKSIVGTGDSPSLETDRHSITPPNGCWAAWPLRPNGEESCWQINQLRLAQQLDEGTCYLASSDENHERVVIKYLKDGDRTKVLTGEIPVIGRDKNTGRVLFQEGLIKMSRPKDVWNMQTHDAGGSGGMGMINEIFKDRRFTFPKSLYAVHDTLRFFVANKPNALIIDFFAGSGTTLHAVNLLNKEDGGNRRCIMVTNNEVSADEETAFRARGIHKGDEEWERLGIARYVCWPRTKCSILGRDVNGNPIKGEYITPLTQEKTIKRTIKQLSFDIPEGKPGEKIKKQIVALINDKNMPQNSVTDDCPYIVKEDAKAAVLFDVSSIDDFIEEIHDDIETIYVTTTENRKFNSVKNELGNLPDRVVTEPMQIPMSEGFASNAAFYKLKFLDKEAVAIGAQLDKLLSILWMKAGAHGVCPEHAEGEYVIFPENKMAILIDEYEFGDLKAELEDKPEIETIYIIDDSEENYRNLAAQLKVKNTYQLYRDYLDNFKINIERR